MDDEVVDMTTSTVLDSIERAAMGTFEVSLAASSAGAKGLSEKDRYSEMKRSQSKLFDQIRIQEQAKEYLAGIPPSRRKVILLIICVVRRFAKGFAVGYAGKLLFAVLGLVLRTKLKPKPFLDGLRRVMFARQTVGYGGFMGGLLAIFEGVMRITTPNPQFENSGGSELNLAQLEADAAHEPMLGRRTRVWVSAALASVAFLCLPQDARSSISMFFFVRAIEVAAIGASEDGYIPTFKHGDTLLMALASAQVIWAWIFRRDTLENSYLRFLDHQGGRSEGKLIKQECCRIHLSYGSEGLEASPKIVNKLNKYRAKAGYPVIDIHSPRFHCENLHPESSSCLWSFALFLKNAFRRAIPVYLPIFILPQVLFRPKALLTKPIQSLVHTALGVARSSTFLSMYCGMCWFTACMITDKIGIRTHLSVACAGFMGGSMVAIEKKNRRIELALYVLSQALPSFYKTMRSLNFAPRLKHSDILLFVFSSCVLLNAFVLRPHLLRPSYVSLFRFLFGRGGRDIGSQGSSPIVKAEKQEKESE